MTGRGVCFPWKAVEQNRMSVVCAEDLNVPILLTLGLAEGRTALQGQGGGRSYRKQINLQDLTRHWTCLPNQEFVQCNGGMVPSDKAKVTAESDSRSFAPEIGEE